MYVSIWFTSNQKRQDSYVTFQVDGNPKIIGMSSRIYENDGYAQ